MDLVGSAPRTSDTGETLTDVEPRPAFATAQLYSSIPPLQRTLSLQVSPDATELEPGGETTLTLLLKGANGEPVSDAELAVIVVDEAILTLTNYQMVDPISVFYAERGSGVMSVYGRSSILLANPQILATDQNRMMDGSGGALLPQTLMEAAMAPSAEVSEV